MKIPIKSREKQRKHLFEWGKKVWNEQKNTVWGETRGLGNRSWWMWSWSWLPWTWCPSLCSHFAFLQLVWRDNTTHDDQKLRVSQVTRILGIESTNGLGQGLIRHRIFHRIDNGMNLGQFEGTILIGIMISEQGFHEFEFIGIEGDFVVEDSWRLRERGKKKKVLVRFWSSFQFVHSNSPGWMCNCTMVEFLKGEDVSWKIWWKSCLDL